MKELKVVRDGKEVIEVRSHGGKLLYIKTSEGYEMMCPRTKQICLVKYQDMYSDCYKNLKNLSMEKKDE